MACILKQVCKTDAIDQAQQQCESVQHQTLAKLRSLTAAFQLTQCAAPQRGRDKTTRSFGAVLPVDMGLIDAGVPNHLQCCIPDDSCA